MQIYNSKTRYGIPAILFHWLMAIIIISLIIVGLYMTRIPLSLLRLKLYGWHKEWGLLVILLVMLRWSWRQINTSPVFPKMMPHWERMAARLTHWTFYLLMLIVPLTGWLLTSASGLPVSFFGWVVLPDLILPSNSSREWLTLIHNYLSYFLLALIVLHISAAIKHHYIEKDDILKRIV